MLTWTLVMAIAFLFAGMKTFAVDEPPVAERDDDPAQDEGDDDAHGELNSDDPPDEDDGDAADASPPEPAFDADYEKQRQEDRAAQLAQQRAAQEAENARLRSIAAGGGRMDHTEQTEEEGPLVPGVKDEDLDPVTRQQLLNDRELRRDVKRTQETQANYEKRLADMNLQNQIANARSESKAALKESLDRMNVYQDGANTHIREWVEKDIEAAIEENLSQHRRMSRAEISELVLNQTQRYKSAIRVGKKTTKEKVKEAEERAGQQGGGRTPAARNDAPSGERQPNRLPRNRPRLVTDPGARQGGGMGFDELRQEIGKERVSYQKERRRR